MGTKKIDLANIFFSKAQQRVLQLLYNHPETDFYTNEIIRLTQSGTGAVQRELTKLTSAGLVNVKQVGNQKRYQANHSTPIFSELRGIVLKTFGLADIIKKALDPIAKKIQFSFIYGSIAKQEDTAESDIDLMIIGKKLTYAELFNLLEKAETQLGRKINPTFYTSIEWQQKYKKGNNFVLQVYNQKKIFLIGTENEFLEFGKSS